jgi:glycosyltransferase involved in cell wall biosynthesis
MICRRIKILYLITGLKTGGAEIALSDLVKSLDRNSFYPIVASIIPIGRIGQEIKKEGIDTRCLNISFKYNPLIIIKLFLLIYREKPDILHTHLFHANFLGRIIGKICGIPIIISTFHNEQAGSRIRKNLLKFTDKFVNINIAVSFWVAKKIIESKIISRKKIKVIYNGINLNKFSYLDYRTRGEIRKKLHIDENNKVLVSVGRLHKTKDYINLIKAIGILCRKYADLKLIIIGSGEEDCKINQQIERSGLKNNILLLGEKRNISEYLNSGDIFVLSSECEGFGIVIVEAMASGLLVVATKAGGISEIVEDGKTGFLVEPKNDQKLAEKINYALNLPMEERKKIIEYGRKVVEEKFYLGRMIKEHEELYFNLLKENEWTRK